MAKLPNEITVKVIDGVKPIFTVGIPSIVTFEEYASIEKMVSEKLKNEYHVILYTHNGDEINFICFNVKDIPEINEDEFKEEIKKLIKK